MKKGRTTGTTYGYLEDNSLTIKVNTWFSSFSYFVFHNCFAVRSYTKDDSFFEQGDSGSGVFLMDGDKTYKALGIAFASLPEMVAVCKIDEILDKLDLQIVRYLENTGEVTEDTHELTEETQEPTEKTQELTDKTQEPSSDTQCLTEDTKDLTKSTQELKIHKKLLENAKK